MKVGYQLESKAKPSVPSEDIPPPLHFANNPLLAELEKTAQRDGLTYTAEATQVNGAVYSGKSPSSSAIKASVKKHFDETVHVLIDVTVLLINFSN